MPAFQPVGKSFSISVGASSEAVTVNLSDLGLAQVPQTLGMINNGATGIDVWVVFSITANPTAAFPTAGTINTGTPAAGMRLKSGIYVVTELPACANGVPNNAGTAQGPGWYMALIASAAGPSVVDFFPGEGQ